jgi:apolipoprotein N-acyltransferase
VTGPAHFTQPGNTFSVSLLQSQVSQDQKFDPAEIPQALAWARDEMFAAPGALVVAPETVIPLLPADLDPGYWQQITRHFHSGDQAVILGIPLGDEETGYTNSALGISEATRNDPQGYYRYDKHHLVPFGEFIPTGFKWFTRLMNIPLGDFNRGPVGAASFGFRGEHIGVNICYEDLFGEELAARFANGSAPPTIFANISNIGWFGDSIAIEQHLQISRMRTLEFQIPMLRATNTGATAAIDDNGRVVASLPHEARGVLNATVQGRRGLTPYARWAARFGLWPLVLVAVGLVCLSAAPRRRRRR